MEQKSKSLSGRKVYRNPWFWVPTAYLAEGIPYVIVMTVSVIMYKRLGITNTDIALYTSWLYLPWVIKLFWSPFIDMFRTKRFWIIGMQLFIGAGLAGVALTIPAPHFFQLTLAFFWLLAFSSATQDIAVDGFYMLGLTQHEQAFFVGIRSTFYRIAMLTGQGLIVILAGYFESTTGLDEVRIQLVSSPGKGIIHSILPDSLDRRGTESGLDLYFTTSDTLCIGTVEEDQKEIDSLLNLASGWNSGHGFTHPAGEKSKTSPVVNQSPKPLANWIQKKFGENKSTSGVGSKAGNIAMAWITLSGKPKEGEQVIANISRISGDKNFNLVEGSRLIFTGNNWNMPACLVFQADPKLEKISSAGFIVRSGNIALSWSICFFILAVLFILFFLYHRFILPFPVADKPTVKAESAGGLSNFIGIFADFFRKKDIVLILAYLLLYRFAEAQLVKMSAPFLLDSREAGGLGLSTGDIGLVYGTIGMLALTAGGIIGGIMAARNGLKFWLWWMISAMNLPILSHLYLSFFQPESLWTIGFFIGLEQIGYGFGFTAYMLYMIYVSRGNHQTAHFAITTGFMALGMMLPGMMSGWLQELIGYRHFFIWVILCTIPGFVITGFLRIDPAFGKREEKK
jgi:PAT family beta-lactamase induction signal transducer AmpG